MRRGGSPPGDDPGGGSPVRITVLGTSFTIRADADPDYLQRLVEFYCSRVCDVSRSFENLDPLKIAILTGVLLSDDLFQARGSGSAAGPVGASEQDREAERIARRLIDTLDRTLGTVD